MVPPPSAVMQPSMHTPAQSMLRRPAASAAVIACAVNATYDKRCRTVSPGGKLHMATSHREPRGIAGSNITGLQLWRGTSAHANHCLAAYLRDANGGTHSWHTNPIRTIPTAPA